MTEDTRFDWIQDELKQHRMAFFSQEKVRSKFKIIYAGATSTAQRREIASRVACARGGKFVQGPVMSELPAGFPGLFWWVTHVEIMLSQQGNIQIVFTAIADGSTIHVIWNSTFGSSLASHYGPIEGSTTKEGVNHVMRCNNDFDLFVRHAFAFENLDRIAKSFEDMEADIKDYSTLLCVPTKVSAITLHRLHLEMFEASKAAKLATSPQKSFTNDGKDDNDEDVDDDEENHASDSDTEKALIGQAEIKNRSKNPKAKVKTPLKNSEPKGKGKDIVEEKTVVKPNPTENTETHAETPKAKKRTKAKTDMTPAKKTTKAEVNRKVKTPAKQTKKKTAASKSPPASDDDGSSSSSTSEVDDDGSSSSSSSSSSTTSDSSDTKERRRKKGKPKTQPKTANKKKPAKKQEKFEMVAVIPSEEHHPTAEAKTTDDSLAANQSTPEKVSAQETNAETSLTSTVLTFGASPKQDLQETPQKEIPGDTLATNQRSAVNKLCRVVFKIDHTFLNKHPAIPMDKGKVRAMSVSEGQRCLDDAHVSVIYSNILQNANTTVNSLSILNMDFDVNRFYLEQLGMEHIFETEHVYGSVGGNHYVAALLRIIKQQPAVFSQHKELHFKDGAVFALGCLKELLNGNYCPFLLLSLFASKNRHLVFIHPHHHVVIHHVVIQKCLSMLKALEYILLSHIPKSYNPLCVCSLGLGPRGQCEKSDRTMWADN